MVQTKQAPMTELSMTPMLSMQTYIAVVNSGGLGECAEVSIGQLQATKLSHSLYPHMHQIMFVLTLRV